MSAPGCARVRMRLAPAGLAACAFAACSDLRPEAPPVDAGMGPDTGEQVVVEPPDPPGPSPWARRTPAVSPASRIGAALAYDPVRRKVVLFGGHGTRTLRDLWEWDGDTGLWTDRTPVALPAVWPSPRLEHALVWDSSRRRVVLFGGDTARGVWLKDLWEWDGEAGAWTDRTPVGPIAAGTWPTQRWGHGMAADEARGRLVVYGGAYANTDSGVVGTPLGDTWEWDGEAGVWTDRTPAPRPAEWPSPRRGTVLTWDGGRARVVMLMGRGTDATTVYEPSIWEWEAGGGVWRRAGPASPETPWPRGREDHGWVWDGARSRLVLFAGWQLPTLGDSVQAESWGDLWELDPAASGAWTDRTLPAGSVAWPLNRARHAMVFDSGRGRVVLFGGTTATARLQDTWEWSGAFP